MDYREELKRVRTFPSLVRFLRDELDWPISSTHDFEDLTFDYSPEELGIDHSVAAKIEEIKRLRPLVQSQPWGIFFVRFEAKRLPVVALRRILSGVVIKKRATSSAWEQPKWQVNDLLFISNYGDESERRISFAHFAQESGQLDLPTLKVIGWDSLDTPLRLDHTANILVDRLSWPEEDAELDTETWRAQWRSAFELQPREVVKTSKALAENLAVLARSVRDHISALLEIETQDGPLTSLLAAFRDGLVHDLSMQGFADMYAQTIAYGLLSARIADPHTSTADDLAVHVRTSPFLRELMAALLNVGTSGSDGGHEGVAIDYDELGVSTIVELLDKANMEEVLLDFGKQNPFEDPVIHFYELFLEEYDKAQKVRRGVFYTPRPLVAYIVRRIHDTLKTTFGLPDGLAATETWREMAERSERRPIPNGVDPDAPFVQILDPAVGTATFLVEIIDVVYEHLTQNWRALGHDDATIGREWTAYVREHLLPRLVGFEIMMAPYAIAHLKIGMKLRETGFIFDESERVNVYLTDSLEPSRDFDGRLAFAVPALAHEAKAVGEVKRATCFTVVLGNPPYLREKERGPADRDERIGGWVRFGDVAAGDQPLFDDFIAPLGDIGAGLHAKLAYELSVMFWRLALWITYELHNAPGIVAFVSPRAYLGGPGHAGMRLFMRELVDQIEIVDLGGDQRGARKSENVFDIETGVAIGLCIRRDDAPVSVDAAVKYSEVLGSSSEKLARLLAAAEGVPFDFTPCDSTDGLFLPGASAQWTAWPRLVDIFPWQHSGVQFKRLWPIAEDATVLSERWRKLLALPPDERAAAFVETPDRRVDAAPAGASANKYTGIARLPPEAQPPRIVKYTYRTLDEQWCFADEKLADRLRPALAATIGPQQVFAITLMSKQLGSGPAVTVTAHLPDMDAFCNRGAKDVIPLWRDSAATAPNVTEGFLEAVGEAVGHDVTPEHLLCYVAAVLGGPGYVARFHSELTLPGPRIPIATDRELFDRGIELGARLVWWETRRERWLGVGDAPNDWTAGEARVAREVPNDDDGYPESFAYDDSSRTLAVGDGVLERVAPQVFGYRVSGFRPVESWLRYRMKARGGRARRAETRSVLDEIRPRRWTFTPELLELLWTVEKLVALWPTLDGWLGEVELGPTMEASALPTPDVVERKEPKPPPQAGLGAL